jgi:hypothetical protein
MNRFNVPGDYPTIQQALDVAPMNSAIEVESGVYFERIVFPRSGTFGGPIILRAAPGAHPILDGTGVPGTEMVLIDTKSHIRMTGFEIQDDPGALNGIGVRIIGEGDFVLISDNTIHGFYGTNATAVEVHATGEVAYYNVAIQNNDIYDCESAPNAAVTIKGKVINAQIVENYIHDVSGGGVALSGDATVNSNPLGLPMASAVTGNLISRAAGPSPGILIDSAEHIGVQRNRVTESFFGIAIRAEESIFATESIYVYDNILDSNAGPGILIGGLGPGSSLVSESRILYNTFYRNSTGRAERVAGGEPPLGELVVDFAENNLLTGNLIFAGPANHYVVSSQPGSATGNLLDFNLYFGTDDIAQANFSLNGVLYVGLASWVSATGLDSHTISLDPEFVAPGMADFHLSLSSPAIDASDPNAPASEIDFYGGVRRSGLVVDIGADEAEVWIFADGFESGNSNSWSAAVPRI